MLRVPPAGAVREGFQSTSLRKTTISCESMYSVPSSLPSSYSGCRNAIDDISDAKLSRVQVLSGSLQ